MKDEKQTKDGCPATAGKLRRLNCGSGAQVRGLCEVDYLGRGQARSMLRQVLRG